MTLKEAIEQACKLTDSEKADYESDLFYILADGAQKWIARNGKHIQRVLTVDVSVCENCKAKGIEKCYHAKKIVLPDDYMMMAPRGIFSYDEPNKSIEYMLRHNLGNPNAGEEFDGNILMVDCIGVIDINYYANPTDITKNTDDSYIFEVSPDTHVAIPYYIAYNLVMSDDVALSTQLKNEWNKYMSVLADVPSVRSVRLTRTQRWGRR